MTDDVIYLIAYAYTYRAVQVPPLVPRNDAFIMGAYDADNDERSGALPCVDFNCAKHITRDIGTVVTAVINPLEQIGAPRGKLWSVGYHPEIEGASAFYRSEPRFYANGVDRAWEVCHRGG